MDFNGEQKIFEKSLELAKNYADTILKGPLSEFSGILTDTVGYWRLKNQVNLLLKTKKFLQDKGIKQTKVLPDVFVPLLQEGSNIENDSLSNMFASLLAGHIESKEQEYIHPSYSKVLSQLSSIDANILVYFRRFVSALEYRELGFKGPKFIVLDIANELNISERSAYISCLNLERLGIIEHTGYRPPEDHPIPNLFEDSMEHQEFRITEYGIAFNDACHHYDD